MNDLEAIEEYASKKPRSVADDKILELVSEIRNLRAGNEKLNAKIKQLNKYESADIRRLTKERDEARNEAASLNEERRRKEEAYMMGHLNA